MAQEKRGPGRPKVMVQRNEVFYDPASLKDYEWWVGVSKETGNHGKAIRRLLVVARTLRRIAPASFHAAMEETKP